MISSENRRVRRLKKNEIQTRLLRAAADIFAAKGFDKATLEEVAETAGFSKGAVYSNYAGKDELFFALMEQHVDERIDLVERTLSGPGTLAERARKAGGVVVEMIRMEPEWQILFIEYWLRAVRNPAMRERFAGRRRALRAKLEMLFEDRRQAEGTTPPLPPADCALATLALSNGLGIEGIIDPESVPSDLYLTIMQKLFS